MNLKSIFTDEEAVSPVIGVILMVAITVILAAVIGTFVLGLGDQVQTTAPSASFTFDYTEDESDDGGDGVDDELVITHDGGDKITATNLFVRVSDATDESASGDTVTYASGASEDWSARGGNDPVTAGEQVTIDENDFTFNDESTDGVNQLDMSPSTIRVTWTGENGDSSATLGKWSGPDA